MISKDSTVKFLSRAERAQIEGSSPNEGSKPLPKHRKRILVQRIAKKETKRRVNGDEDTFPVDDPLYASSNFNGKNKSLDLKLNEQKHWTAKSKDSMTERDWRIFREDFQIQVSSKSIQNLPKAIRSWDEINCSLKLKIPFPKPSPIQMQSIPLISHPFNVMGISKTGSGKTLAFLIPLIILLQKEEEKISDLVELGPLSLILAPTRELAQQIKKEADKLGSKFKFCVIVGGIPMEEQFKELRRGIEVIVATPGRLIDVLETRQLVLSQCRYIVLDEADTMISLGFHDQVSFLLNKVKQEMKMISMFSATMPKEVESLAAEFMKDKVTVRIGNSDDSILVNKNITHKIVCCSEGAKFQRLKEALKETGPPILVFCNSRAGCKPIADFVNSISRSRKMRAEELHAGKQQKQREQSLRDFNSGKCGVLVATDLAGRGLDVDGIRHVINFDMASTIERFTHRCGRTGRASKKGFATSFVTLEKDQEIFKDLANFLRDSNLTVPRELELTNGDVIEELE